MKKYVDGDNCPERKDAITPNWTTGFLSQLAIAMQAIVCPWMVGCLISIYLGHDVAAARWRLFYHARPCLHDYEIAIDDHDLPPGRNVSLDRDFVSASSITFRPGCVRFTVEVEPNSTSPSFFRYSVIASLDGVVPA